MKHLLLLLLTLNLTFSFSQPKIGKEIVNTSTIYTIDESWEPKGATRFKADETSYIHISNGYFVISERTRGKTLYLEGDIADLVETTKGGIHFWIKVRGHATVVCDINPLDEGVDIHIYNTVGRYDKYYSGHLATKEEVKKLLENIRKD